MVTSTELTVTHAQVLAKLEAQLIIHIPLEKPKILVYMVHIFI